MQTARDHVDRIQQARWQADLVAAFERYHANSDASTLGQQIEVVPRDNNTGFRLVANSNIEMGRPLTAFDAGALVMLIPHQRDWDGQVGEFHSSRKKDTPALAYRYFSDPSKNNPTGPPKLHLAVGPLTADEATLKHHFRHCASPVVGYAPAHVVVSDTEGAQPTPDKAAMWVEDVVDLNPYDSLIQSSDAIPTFAQVTVAYLKKVAALANVRVGTAEDIPTVIIAVRAILKGEVLRTGRPPLYWIKSRAYAELIYEHLLADRARRASLSAEAGESDPSLPVGVLRDMIFGDGSD